VGIERRKDRVQTAIYRGSKQSQSAAQEWRDLPCVPGSSHGII
jgi:hypothetical protein